MADTWMTREEAAAYLRVTRGHLANLASEGAGPRYAVGRPILYRREDLDAWVEERATAPAA